MSRRTCRFFPNVGRHHRHYLLEGWWGWVA